jgi:hypothetical protein
MRLVLIRPDVAHKINHFGVKDYPATLAALIMV